MKNRLIYAVVKQISTSLKVGAMKMGDGPYLDKDFEIFMGDRAPSFAQLNNFGK